MAGVPSRQRWLDQQLILQNKILARVYELGMTPDISYMPAFHGHFNLDKGQSIFGATALVNEELDAACKGKRKLYETNVVDYSPNVEYLCESNGSGALFMARHTIQKQV